MKLLKYFLLVFISLGISSSLFAKEFSSVFLHSIARDIDSKKVVYTETFSKSAQGDKLQVIFKGPNGKYYANKTLNFSKSSFQPEMKVINKKLNHTTEIRIHNGQAVIKTSQQNSNKRSEKQKQLKLPANTMIDIGMERFIRQNWDTLLANKVLPVNYLMSEKAKVYRLNIKHIRCKKPLITSSICFTAKLANPIFRALAGSSFFEYDRNKKQIIKFTGVGQLFNENGNLKKVDITYHRIPPKYGQL